MVTLSTPIESVPRVSARIVPALRRLGIRTVRDLLFHFPSRYEEFPEEQAIAEASAGERATIAGVIQKIAERRTAKGLRLTEAMMTDETGAISVVWFNQPFLARTLKKGDTLRLSGKIARGLRGLSLQNPSYEKITRAAPDGAARRIHTGGLIPVYPETDGITSRWLRFLIKTYLPLRNALKDPLPVETRNQFHLPEIKDAINAIHFPKSKEQAATAERRFIFEELLLVQLRALRERSRMQQRSAPAIPFDIELMRSFVASLPFHLTDAQRRSLWEIGRDMARQHPMNRLLEGDVGSGKTVVAAAASLLAVRSGHRAAFMAPTEILARQHYTTLSCLLEQFHVAVGLLTGSDKKIKGAPADAGAPDIIVGTHALIQKNIRLENLGLVIVDEQHRFGVSQRATLATGSWPLEAGQKMLPHFLSMTATPIPRTLALTIYGDLDLSLLDEMPKNRKTVITRVVPPDQRAEAYRFIRDEVKKERQIFVICPRIEVRLAAFRGSSPAGSRTSQRSGQQALLLADVKTVTDEHKKLSEFIFPDLRIAMLHGRMKAKEKAAAMKKFHDRETDILVSTSVIEVGVDVPNATIMMIEGAERFGLAQLHQFRGRVGRGAEQSYCFLFPTEDGPVARRLRAVVDAKNGFELAEYDLKIRGPGDMFGTQQWGVPDMAIKGLADPELVREVRSAAMEIAQHSPNLSDYPLLLARLQEMEKTLHLE